MGSCRRCKEDFGKKKNSIESVDAGPEKKRYEKSPYSASGLGALDISGSDLNSLIDSDEDSKPIGAYSNADGPGGGPGGGNNKRSSLSGNLSESPRDLFGEKKV